MVLNSIPKDWLQVLKTETAKPDETFYIKLTQDTKPKNVTELTCRWIYTALMLDEARSTEHAYRQAWGITFGPINWESTFKHLQKNNFDRKANDLRRKILHRCLPTAKRLAGRSPFFPSSTCQVCGKHEENLTHLFFLCPSAKSENKNLHPRVRVDQAVRPLPPKTLSILVGLILKLTSMCITIYKFRKVWTV